MTRPLIILGAALGLALLAAPTTPARAHGGLPLSTEIVWRKDTMYLPTQYWGIFVGQEGGPWRWICDEAINNFRLRQVYLGGDDTFYATDLQGLTISRDGGCNWEPVTGPLAMADVSSVLPDPAQPQRVWALAVQDGQPVLWRSDDSGRAFQQVFKAPAQAQRGLALGPSGKRAYLSALRLETGVDPTPVIYASSDGERFTERTLTPRPPFLRTIPLYVDPRDERVVYVVSQGDPTQVLLRIDGDSGAAKELLRVEGTIYDVRVDSARGRLLVATSDGLHFGDSADGAGPLTRSEGLSRTQCTSVRGEALYACSWNYYPDMAAVARSDDGGRSFRRVFQYADTQGVLSCPAGSGVARVCPAVWDTYASLLGINTVADMGGTAPDPPPGCSCSLGRGEGDAAPSGAGAALGLLALLGLRGRWPRRRGRLT